MSSPKFVWIIRSWCSLDSFWEHVREHKEFDVAYTHPELLLQEIDRILLKEQSDWQDLCIASGSREDTHTFIVEKPTLDLLKSRPFVKFLTISTTDPSHDYMQSWYIERLKIASSD